MEEWKGRPVPWVARWTNEVSAQRYEVAPNRDGRLTYKDGNNTYDKNDPTILWQREGINRGGEPMWADVSTYRQRAAMLKRLCQVCGNKIPDGPINWLLTVDTVEQYPMGEGEPPVSLTSSAPTCDGCVDVALNHCPHMIGKGGLLATIADYKIWGVSGLVFVEGMPMNTARPYHDEPFFKAIQGLPFLAQQIVVQLGAITDVRQVGGKT